MLRCRLMYRFYFYWAHVQASRQGHGLLWSVGRKQLPVFIQMRNYLWLNVQCTALVAYRFRRQGKEMNWETIDRKSSGAAPLMIVVHHEQSYQVSRIMRETHAFDASVTPRVTSHALFLPQNLTHGFWRGFHAILLSRDLSLGILVDFTLRVVIFVLIIV